MCDIQPVYVKDESCSEDSEESSDTSSEKLDDSENFMENARVINSDGLRMRIAKEKVCLKPNIEEEFIKKGFEVEARFPNINEQSTRAASKKLKEFQARNINDYSDEKG